MIYILRHDDPISYAYSETAAESCEKLELEWKYFEGFSNISANRVHHFFGIEKQNHISITSSENKAALCTLGHIAIWKDIIENQYETAIILEHDALMLHRFDLEIPDNVIVALGYKETSPHKYNHERAGAPTKIVSIESHNGSHAYALNNKTAQTLLKGYERNKTIGCIDKHVFQRPKYRNGVDIAIADPICAIGWLRESTIWKKSSEYNRTYIESYSNNYET